MLLIAVSGPCPHRKNLPARIPVDPFDIREAR